MSKERTAVKRDQTQLHLSTPVQSSSVSVTTLLLDEHDLVRDVLHQCELQGFDVITDLCNNFERSTVIIPNPSYVSILFDESKWRSSYIKTLYLFSPSPSSSSPSCDGSDSADRDLQTSIQHIVSSCKGKLFLRLFARHLPIFADDRPMATDSLPTATTRSPLQLLEGWSTVIHPDDRSPPFRRVMILPFLLGKSSPEERDEFLDQAHHELADLIIFEHLDESKWHVSDWAAIMRRHSGIPSEQAIVKSSDGRCFGMVTRFHHQGEQSERAFYRKGVSVGDLPSVSAKLI